MNILLINPSANPDKVYASVDNMYPYSLLFVVSFLLKHGIQATVLDLSTSAHPEKRLIEFISKNTFDVVGFTGTTENRFLVWDLISKTRAFFPSCFIVVGGNHFTFSAEQTLESIHEIDVVVRGEGEITFLELAQRIAAKKDYSDIEGISYRGRGKIHHNPERAPEFQIDKFQIVDEAFDSVVNPTGNYSPFLTLRNYEKEDIKALSIHVGRGCPGKCVFCLYNKKRYRARSVDSVLDEIKNKMERFDCHAFHLDDPHLLKRSSFIVDFCNRIIDEKLEIIWYAETRADIDLGLLPLMRKAGCISLDFAIESASPKVIKAIRKNIRIEQAERLIEACRENRIKIKLFTMISLPDETEEDAQLTIDFLKKHKDHITNFSGGITRIYPGSELEEMAYSRKILPPDFSWYDRTYKNPFETAIHCQNVPIWMEHLSPKRIMELKKEVDFIISERKYTLSYIFLLIKKQMGPFLLNWNISEIKIKRKTLANFFKIVRYKIEEMLRTP